MRVRSSGALFRGCTVGASGLLHQCLPSKFESVMPRHLGSLGSFPNCTWMCITTLLDCWICPIPPRFTSGLNPLTSELCTPRLRRYPMVLTHGSMKKIRAEPARVCKPRMAEMPASELWNLTSSCGETPAASVSCSERRISMLMKVAMATRINSEKVSRNSVSTVRTAAASSIRNESTARYMRSRSRRTEKILMIMLNRTMCTVELMKLWEK